MTRLFVPGVTREDEDPQFVCTVPVDVAGTPCGREFYEDERLAFQHHVGSCAREHMDLIRAQRLTERLPAFAPWDPELEEHMRKVGERMRREGRLVVRPNERAGF